VGKKTAPAPQEQRFAAYVEGLAEAAGHAHRHSPLKNYGTGLLLPGERKSGAPMAARLAGDEVRRRHQALHHLVADAPWDDEAVLDRGLEAVIPAMLHRDPILAWIVDDTGFPKKGRESVGVARQYGGPVGKQDNCRVAVRPAVTSAQASMPVAFRLYLPESWVQDRQRRKKTGVPESIPFQTKTAIAVDQIRRARQRGVPQGVVLGAAGYGTDTQFRTELTKLEMGYVGGVQSTTTVWQPGAPPKPTPARKGKTGRPRKLLQRNAKCRPISAKELALSLPTGAWKNVTWRPGVKQKWRSRYAALRVPPAHRDYGRSEPHPEEWLRIEWPVAEPEPTPYGLSTLPADSHFRELVQLAKHRWIIERDYPELKQELGLGHSAGRGWRGFPHHATLGIAAFGFLVAARNRFSPSARVGYLGLPRSSPPPDFPPRGSPPSARAA
jgi:SRSO17 transposase